MSNVEDYSMAANPKSPVLPSHEGDHPIGKRCRIASVLLNLGNDTLSIPRCRTPNILDGSGRPFDFQPPLHYTCFLFAKSKNSGKGNGTGFSFVGIDPGLKVDKAAKKVSRQLRDRVQVEVTSAGNREPLFELLRDEIGGRLSEAVESLRNAPGLSLTQFVDACRSGADELRATYGITPSQTERLAGGKAEVFMQIEELELASTTAIHLNTAPAGGPQAWQPLESLSTGQKATAVLLLLLLESGAPLIVDQPRGQP